MPERSPHDGGDLPAHPERAEPAGPATEGRRWGGVVVVALLGVLCVVIVVVHLVGIVGPGAH